MRNSSLEVLEGRIGYHFKDKYLLECALTHTSFANEQKIHRYKDYERLEFLGDAVLEMVSSAFLYNEYPDKREGELTKLRASLVCEPSLADCADVGKGVADIEALAELNPDVFFHKASDVETLESVEKIGVPAVGVDVETPEDMITALDIMGKVCGAEEKAAQLKASAQ